jgi:hypothetical protein|tara:strand:+ start:829 stop:1191 length:363 start_codon:yes stop_codon:yes gene_type:complete
MKINDNTNISLPVRNLIALLAAVAFGIFAYTEITTRLTSLETSRHIMETDLISKSDQKITDQEQFLLLEMLTTSQENTDEEMQSMRNNNVNLNRAMEDIKEMKETIEILKDKVRANGNSH